MTGKKFTCQYLTKIKLWCNIWLIKNRRNTRYLKKIWTRTFIKSL